MLSNVKLVLVMQAVLNSETARHNCRTIVSRCNELVSGEIRNSASVLNLRDE